MLNPSEIVIRPAGPTERAAEHGATQSPLPEATPSLMAERFAPGGQKAPEAAGRTRAEPPPAMQIAPEPRPMTPGRWMLAASILISLVPTAIILALIWQGAIRLPPAHDAPVVLDLAPGEDMKQVAAIAVPALPAPRAADAAPKPEIALTTPARLEAKAGEEVNFDIAIDSAEGLPARSFIAIRALPEGASFSQGRAYAETEWNLRPDEIGDLKLKLPQLDGISDLRVELMAADGTVLASSTTRLAVAPDPKSDLILRSEDSGRIADLIAHGQKMIDVGYLAGARAYFQRAAEAGSGDAALRLGATFDPEFISEIGALGVKADLDEARLWYRRAEQLGVEGAAAKLKALKESWSSRAPSQAAEAEPAAAAAGADANGPGRDEAALASTREEWVSLSSYANVRAAPSTTAETLRVAEKGAKLRVTGREGNWVQVTDPATAEVGWVYSRFIETAQSPAE
jgi:TPR repeat protein